jgi:K+-transporting ATPase ATPase B chain
METSTLRKRMPVSALLDAKIIVPAIGSAFRKLDPRTLAKNPIIFVLEMVTLLTTVLLVRDLVTGAESVGFTFQIVLWLWFTVLFANFAEAVAEGRGKAQADALRRTRTETQAKLLGAANSREYALVPGTGLKVGDIVLVEAGDIIPSDGEVILGERGRHYRRVCPRHPRGRRRPLGRHRRHPGALRLDPRAGHGGTRLDLPRPHDQAG